jgi:hypothetical protein
VRHRFNYASQQWGPAYSAAVWPSTASSPSVSEPSHFEFCVPSKDNCQPNAAPDETGTANSAGLCTLANSHCWWHYADTWQTNCLAFCGTQHLSYTASSTRPSFTDIYPPDGCTASGLPSNAVIVDTTVSAGTCSGTKQWTSQGSMSFYFPASQNSSCSSNCIQYQGKVDFHQLGTGFGGHIFFSHMTNTPVDTGTSYTDDSMTATWAPPSSVTGWTRIKVHVPNSGATTRQADYQINLGGGQSRHRLVTRTPGLISARSTWPPVRMCR